MKQLAFNLKQGEAKVLVQNPDDLWYLNNIIDPGDVIRGKTLRKLKPTEEARAERKLVLMAITVEKVDYAASELRVSGKVIEGPEDVPRGSYHTFSIEQGVIVTIIKQEWLGYQLEYLKEAATAKTPKIVICIFDREEALFARLLRDGHEILGTLKGKVAKKAVEEKVKETFYEGIVKQLEEYDRRFGLDKIIVASPAFWKEELYKALKNPALRKKMLQATCSGVDETAIAEVLKRQEVRQALQAERVSKELAKVEELFLAIAKKGLAAYGVKETAQAADAGAIQELLVTDKLIQRARAENRFAELDRMMKAVDRGKGKVWIISSEHEGGRKLQGLGGIGAILRYKIF